jgi:superfamily II DNA or RNA helicase
MDGGLFPGTFPEPRLFQTRTLDALRDGVRDGHQRQVLMAPTGAGKCLGIDTPILMADGSIKPVQSVRAGDRVMGPDGKARNVLSLGRGREVMYRVTPTKGDSYACNASHILSLKKTPGGDGILLADGTRVERDQDYVEVPAGVFARSNATAKHVLKGWRAPRIESFERGFDDDDRLVPPYILGAWLGDGTCGRAAISKPMCNMVREWIAYGESVGYQARERGEDCPTWLLTKGHDGLSFNSIQSQLETLGVLFDKHVPDEYKFGPAAVREQVVAGLIDSDGHITHGGCDWISKDRRLADDFVFMCRSLGLAAYIAQAEKGIAATGFVGMYWRVSVSGDLSTLPMRDKKAKPREQKKRHLVHGIRLEPLGEGDYYGFMLDGDGLFLLGDFTVTHNTYLGLWLISQAMKRGKRAVFVCDRTTLINQTSATADGYGLTDHGVIQADHYRTKPWLPFQIASVQTLARRSWPQADLIVVDECHTMYKTVTDHIERTSAAVVGLSATPFTKGMGKFYSNIVNAATMAELVASGVLVPMRVFSATRPDMRGAKVNSRGEWDEAEAGERGMEIVGDVVAEWTRYGEGRKTICFGANIKHCEELCRQFREIGVSAALFTSHTKPEERAQLLRDFQSGELRILISVEALAKGFDVPDVGCVIDCRPLRKSLSTAIQMWGRGLRCAPGKTDCILLDHSGNILRFADDFEEIYHAGLAELDDGERLDREVRKEPEDERVPRCPQCGFAPFARRCMSCGHEKVVRSLVESVPGHMREVVIGGKKYADNALHLYQQCYQYAVENSVPDKRRGRAAHIYKDITGSWPTRAMTDAPMGDVFITRTVINKIRQKNIAFNRSRKAA